MAEKRNPNPAVVNSQTGQRDSTPAPSIPDFTVKVYPVRDPKNKFLGNANVTIAGCFAVKGFSIFQTDKNERGMFVREPQHTYFKNGTQLESSAFFPVTKEAREKLYGQIMDSYELVINQERARQSEDTDWLMSEDNESPAPAAVSPDDDLPFTTMPPSFDIPTPTDEDIPAMMM